MNRTLTVEMQIAQTFIRCCLLIHENSPTTCLLVELCQQRFFVLFNFFVIDWKKTNKQIKGKVAAAIVVGLQLWEDFCKLPLIFTLKTISNL